MLVCHHASCTFCLTTRLVGVVVVGVGEGGRCVCVCGGGGGGGGHDTVFHPNRHLHLSPHNHPSWCNGHNTNDVLPMYRKIPIISYGLIFAQKAFSLGLFSGELIFGGALVLLLEGILRF